MQGNEQNISDLEQLLEQMAKAAKDRDVITLDHVLDRVGRRSFGPMLLVAGVIISLPIVGDIPGVPILMGLFIILIAVQMLVQREHIWLPQWLLRRSISKEKYCKALAWAGKPARFIDRLLRPRLTWLTGRVGLHVIATTCIAISAATPVMEFIPFSANVAGAAITAFGLSLVARDGLLAAIAFTCTAAVAGLLVYQVL